MREMASISTRPTPTYSDWRKTKKFGSPGMSALVAVDSV